MAPSKTTSGRVKLRGARATLALQSSRLKSSPDGRGVDIPVPLKGFVDRWVRAQRAKPCPTPDQWPPSRAACQEDIAQLLGFTNWHEAISAIRQIQGEPLAQTVGASERSSLYPTAIDSTHDAVSFLTWAYDQGLTLLDFHVGTPISSQGRVVTGQALSNLQHAVFQKICLASHEKAAPQLLLRPKLLPLQFHCKGIEDGHMTVSMSTHQPVFPTGFEVVPEPLMALLEAPPKQGLILMAGLADLLPSIASFTAERYVRMPDRHRIFHTLPELDLTQRFGAHPSLIQYNGPETLDFKIRMATRRRPSAMVLGEAQTAKDTDQIITASLVGHLVYASHAEGRVVDAVVDWVEQFPEEEHLERIVDVLSVLHLLVGGSWGRSADGSPQWNYEYLLMNDGLVDEMLDAIKDDHPLIKSLPILTTLRNVLETAMREHGHTLKTSAIRGNFSVTPRT